MILKIILSLIVGYLIGSISPSYILGKKLKGIDIREYGTKNAGTMNAYQVLGFSPAALTGMVDVFKGLFAMAISFYMGAPSVIIHLTGIAAILGHDFPFYMKFKGGQGVGTAVGMLL
ncbi:MAG: glycerol-3-phosphate acyltransferase, partial [Fidelibacterota bacterium]